MFQILSFKCYIHCHKSILARLLIGRVCAGYKKSTENKSRWGSTQSRDLVNAVRHFILFIYLFFSFVVFVIGQLEFCCLCRCFYLQLKRVSHVCFFALLRSTRISLLPDFDKDANRQTFLSL